MFQLREDTRRGHISSMIIPSLRQTKAVVKAAEPTVEKTRSNEKPPPVHMALALNFSIACVIPASSGTFSCQGATVSRDWHEALVSQKRQVDQTRG
jgi:hypothetical protein